MRLSARILSHVADANTFEVHEQAEFTEGDSTYIYFMLIDETADRAVEGFNPPGRRYIPNVTSTLAVSFLSVEASRSLQRNASMAFPNDDRSIWKVPVYATDKLVGSRDMKLTLTEGTGASQKTTSGVVRHAICAVPLTASY